MKKKIAFITLSLEGGGAEKMLSRLILNIHDELDIVLITFYRQGRYLEELLSVPGLRYYCLNAGSGNTLSFAGRLRKILKAERPAKVMSFLYYPNIITCLSVPGMNIPVILSERSNHRLYLSGSVKHRIWKFLLGRAYSRASSVITVSSESGKALSSDFGIPLSKIHTIYNGLSFPLLDRLKSEKVTEFSFNPDVKYILAVGSINRAKNYGLLLGSFSILYSRHKQVQLIIIGKGDLEEELRNKIDSLNLKDVVHLPGYCSNPYKFMAAASCYVLSSRWEGFPNSLLEAMYINGHVVSTDCPTGPSEIISDNMDGILCGMDNAMGMTDALEKMCFDDDFRGKVFENSRKTILKFDESIMINRYKELFLK